MLWIEKHKATTVGATTTAVALGESTTTTTMERCEKEEHDALKEKQELVDTLQETIDALTAEINEVIILSFFKFSVIIVLISHSENIFVVKVRHI